MSVRAMRSEDHGQAWRADTVGRIAAYTVVGVFSMIVLYGAALYFLAR